MSNNDDNKRQTTNVINRNINRTNKTMSINDDNRRVNRNRNINNTTNNNKHKNTNNNKNTHRRTFSIVDYPSIGELHGNYRAKYPENAAEKVLSELAKRVNLKNTNDKNFIFFTIRDQKSGNEYSYIGTRVELYQPVKLNNGQTIRYRNILTRVTDDKMSIYNIQQ